MKIIKENGLLKEKCVFVDLNYGKKIAKRMWMFLNTYNKKNKSNFFGLSANQFGINASVCLVKKNGANFILINPRILKFSEIKIINKETCLSFSDVTLDVYRHKWVEVSADNHSNTLLFGNRGRENILENNIESCVVQHEIAHLNGLSFHDFQWNNSPTPNEWFSNDPK